MSDFSSTSIRIVWAWPPSDGTAVSEEMILPLIADYLLPGSPGKLVITNLSSTALLEHVVPRTAVKCCEYP